jgi:hypothetical protein
MSASRSGVMTPAELKEWRATQGLYNGPTNPNLSHVPALDEWRDKMGADRPCCLSERGYPHADDCGTANARKRPADFRDA